MVHRTGGKCGERGISRTSANFSGVKVLRVVSVFPDLSVGSV